MPENNYEDLLVQLHDLGGLYQDAEEVIRELLAERADIWDAGCIQGQFDGLAHFSPNPYRDRSDT